MLKTFCRKGHCCLWHYHCQNVVPKITKVPNNSMVRFRTLECLHPHLLSQKHCFSGCKIGFGFSTRLYRFSFIVQSLHICLFAPRVALRCGYKGLGILNSALFLSNLDEVSSIFDLSARSTLFLMRSDSSTAHVHIVTALLFASVYSRRVLCGLQEKRRMQCSPSLIVPCNCSSCHFQQLLSRDCWLPSYPPYHSSQSTL